MVDVDVRSPVAPGDVAAMRTLAEAVRRDDGRVTLDDEAWRDLATPPPRSAIVLALDDGDPRAAAYVAPAEGADTGRFDAELVFRATDRDLAPRILDAAIDHVRVLRGTHLQLWASGAGPDDDRLAAACGLAPTRELWQMRVPLPVPDVAKWPPGVHVRAFVPRRDADAWLVVNNRSFAADPDQSGWSHEELDRRVAEPWFDPAGFLLAVDGERLVGFCWTKVHPPDPPAEPVARGEIYVIGVEPDHQGRGLGRALVVAGLASLHERGLSVGMLFVDAGNTPAVALYRALGFEVTRVDRAYIREVT